MVDRERMKLIFREMIDAARAGDEKRVADLNSKLESLMPDVDERWNEEILEIDRGRQSVHVALLNPMIYDEAMQDAEERYSVVAD